MRRRRALADGAACPRYTIERVDWPKSEAIDWEAYAGSRKRVGGIMTVIDRGTMSVQSIGVDEEHRRCGLGTKLYEAAAKYGCEHGMGLESDNIRSADSQGFWAKQERKGRARCIVGAPAPDKRVDTGGPRMGRGGCGIYRLSCPVTDLSGRKRRKK